MMNILHNISGGVELGHTLGTAIATLTNRSVEKGACWGAVVGAAAVTTLLLGAAVLNRGRDY